LFRGEIYPTENVPVKDISGAGDTFGGGFISCLANDGTMDEALINASVLASFCVEDFGTDAIIEADKKEIIRRRTYLQDRIR
jgi:sugar/nucleoside kinase (ribokinase family)